MFEWLDDRDGWDEGLVPQHLTDEGLDDNDGQNHKDGLDGIDHGFGF